MNKIVIARAWRNPLFRLDLPPSMRGDLPLHPAGESSEDETDWGFRMDITFGGGCGSAGCSKVVCTDPCGTLGAHCPKPTEKPGCTSGSGC